MSLCNVHANLFKGAIQNVEVADTDHPGHPVQIFKQENLALRAAPYAGSQAPIYLWKHWRWDLLPEIRKGLQRQLGFVKFDLHYQRKEELMFPIMESYGHDSPPKVMWGVDDQIRDLFQEAQDCCRATARYFNLKSQGQVWDLAAEFEAMIFRKSLSFSWYSLGPFIRTTGSIAEERVLWYTIAQSQQRNGFLRGTNSRGGSWECCWWREVERQPTRTGLSDGRFPAGHWVRRMVRVTILCKPKGKEGSKPLIGTPSRLFGMATCPVAEANLILDHLPMEITFGQ